MRFIDRENEMAYVKAAKALSSKKLHAISIYGLRRVGKTRLILEFLQEGGLYFFVNKNKTSGSLLKEYEESIKRIGLLTELESVSDWDSFFGILFERYKGVVVFDEFQNFVHVEKAVFGILQKLIDLNENRKGILFVFSGSTVGLIKRLFSDGKEPLYGRIKRQLQLKPLSFSNVIKMCGEINIRDISEILELYAVFGGFPRYYVAVEDENLGGGSFNEILERFLLVENATFENEVMAILSLEFGKRSGTYYDILAAIANGCTRISEIASFLGKKETAITRHINELTHYFDIIGVEKQVVGKRRVLFINHPLMDFWFKFFYKNLSGYKRREGWLINKIRGEVNHHIGRRFEFACREFLSEMNARGKLPFKFDIIGRQWGKIPQKPKGKNQYEIDIVALNEKTKQILFGECKWQDNVNAFQVLAGLKEKAGFVEWHGVEEHFVIFAKSFRERAKEPSLSLFTLADMKKLFS